MTKKPATIEELKLPIAAEELANNIATLAAGMRSLSRSNLKRDTIVLLLNDSTGLGKRDIARLLTALENLDAYYLKKPKSTEQMLRDLATERPK